MGHEVLTLSAEVRAAFYSYVSLHQQLELQRQIVEAHALSAELARRQFDAGNLPDIDLTRLEAAYTSGSLELAHVLRCFKTSHFRALQAQRVADDRDRTRAHGCGRDHR